FDGVCLLVAGVLLLTPGFLTDAVGFLLLIPPVRLAIGAGIWHRMQQSGNFTVHAGPRPDPSQRPGGDYPDQGPGPVIDTDYSVIDEDKGSNDREPRS
ncbi:MAG: FxsA family protein, partial [Rhodospirillales bacterium]